MSFSLILTFHGENPECWTFELCSYRFYSHVGGTHLNQTNQALTLPIVQHLSASFCLASSTLFTLQFSNFSPSPGVRLFGPAALTGPLLSGCLLRSSRADWATAPATNSSRSWGRVPGAGLQNGNGENRFFKALGNSLNLGFFRGLNLEMIGKQQNPYLKIRGLHYFMKRSSTLSPGF